jgi:hypothetical protein
MIITKLHLEYWRAKHVPSWVSKIEERSKIGMFPRKTLSEKEALKANPLPGPTVHDLINAQVKPSGYPYDIKACKPKDPHSLHNTLSLLKIVRKNIETGAEKRDMVSYLEHLRLHGQQGGRDKWAARWLRKIRPNHEETPCPRCHSVH